ncbi:MAG: carbon storage regulator [Thermogutta sp.]|nr:carbon storage regulator [Thermogutta sp.]
MLVLSRKENQRIRLGDNITITIVRVTGDQVRVGIDAPKTVPIIRDELNPRDREGGRPGNGPREAAPPIGM